MRVIDQPLSQQSTQVSPSPRITQRRRDEIFAVLDGLMDQRLLNFCYYVDHHKRAGAIFKFLLSNGFTGQKLIELLEQECEGKYVFTLVTKVVNMMEREERNLLMGKDFT